MEIQFTVDGSQVSVPDDGASLLEVLRDRLGVRSPKDGCSPQGQCGCCTVWVDGAPRVACVTPARRVAGREITTIAGLDPDLRDRWANAFVATGASQCGFCTPGILMRLAAGSAGSTRQSVNNALLAHLCRCTGWRTIFDAADLAASDLLIDSSGRDLAAAARRARLEGGTPQQVGPGIALGEAGFADDTAPLDALVAVPTTSGEWVVAETLLEARVAAGKVQGRRTTLEPRWPIDLPPGEWAVSLQTTWTEPAYLETDASWCLPGGEPASPLANGGAFGGKSSSPVQAVARRLADEHGRAVRVLMTREDTVRLGPKRPPLAVAARPDGSGVIRAARTPGLTTAIAAAAPNFDVEEIDIAGPPTSVDIRGAGWLEAAVVAAAAREEAVVRAPSGGEASAHFDSNGTLAVSVSCGDPLDEIVLRSYCTGAAHMALGLVRSEGIAVDDEGTAHDLTIRSFGILRAVDTPEIRIEVASDDGPPVNGSDAVMAAVALAAWRAEGLPPRWPTERVQS
ncbi:MAG TPA: 2Fe-2S iron-sulfur cluster-binding protein [Acidimicrobiales bacterium]|nr:2Fe-2S iron-sulfur cluster-binding protein [Acidimicrobiales bacterium]